MAEQPLYLRVGETVRGPFEMDQLRQAALAGRLRPSHEASVDGKDWFRLETIWERLAVPSTDPAPSTANVDSAAAPTSSATPSPQAGGEAQSDSVAPPPLPAEPVSFEAPETASSPFSFVGDGPSQKPSRPGPRPYVPRTRRPYTRVCGLCSCPPPACTGSCF